MICSSHSRPARLAAAVTGTLLLAGCAGGDGGTDEAADQKAEATTVTVTNCGQEVTYPSPAERIYVTGDGNTVAVLLELGAADQIVAVGGLDNQRPVLAAAYGAEVVDTLPNTSADYPSFETVIARQPDVVYAGWNYGFSRETGFTPESLARHDIAAYALSESCQQEDGGRGTIPPWDAVTTDLENMGAITGRDERAGEAVADTRARLDALEAAPQAETPPTVFLFDGGGKDVLTSGSFGGPQAIIDAAGGRNATEDVADTWVTVSWERIVAAQPDFFTFVDYSGQTFDEKVELLRTNPATRDLPAVKENRFLNLPIAAWTSGPLNIDAAEVLRKELEKWKLLPASDIEPRRELPVA